MRGNLSRISAGWSYLLLRVCTQFLCFFLAWLLLFRPLCNTWNFSLWLFLMFNTLNMLSLLGDNLSFMDNLGSTLIRTGTYQFIYQGPVVQFHYNWSFTLGISRSKSMCYICQSFMLIFKLSLLALIITFVVFSPLVSWITGSQEITVSLAHTFLSSRCWSRGFEPFTSGRKLVLVGLKSFHLWSLLTPAFLFQL